MPKVIDHQKKKSELLVAASIAISEYGLGNVTLTHIARSAGCTTGTLGYYFAGKRDIVKQAFSSTFDRIDERLKQRIEENGDSADLAEVLAELLPLDDARYRECRMWVNFWAHASYDRELMHLNEEMAESWVETIGQCLSVLWAPYDNLSPSQRKHLTDMLTAFLSGLIVQTITQPERYSAQEATMTLRSFLRLILSSSIQDVQT